MRKDIQRILDAILSQDGVFSYWNQKTKTKGEDPDEYVVYYLNSQYTDFSADNEDWKENRRATVIYFYRDSMLFTSDSRNTVERRINLIRNAFKSEKYRVVDFDGGEIQQDGYLTTIFEIERWKIHA